MNTEEFLMGFNDALKRDRSRFATGPTLAEVTEAAVWFMSLWEAEQMHECNTIKDWAHIVRDGLPALRDHDMQEWLDNEEGNWDDEDLTFRGHVVLEMIRWGWK